MTTHHPLVFLLWPILALCLACTAAAEDLQDKKILVVMSYHQGNPWQDQQREGIESVLAGARLEYFDLDTKRHEADGAAKAKEALARYHELKPDVVISADDPAQSFFVVPYLKDKVKTPIVFLGVNDDAAKYGFPASNVTGVIEIKHFKQSISFAQLLLPDLKHLAVLYVDNISNRLNVAELKRQQSSLSAEISRYLPVKTLAELETAVRDNSGAVEAFFSLHLAGLLDERGEPMESAAAIAKLSRLSPRAILASDSYEIEAGALCGVIKTGQEQGELAAAMVRELLTGKAIKDIPLTKNTNGRRYINIRTAHRLGITLPSIAVAGSKLVK